MSEQKFKVGDRVRVKNDETTVAHGWLRPGQIGTISARYGETDIYRFYQDSIHGGRQESRYFARELELVEPTNKKKPTRADVNRLLKKARKVASVYDDADSTLDEYLRALRKFEQAVTEVMNK